MASKTDAEKAERLLAHLDGPAFDFYYDTFAEDGSLKDTAKDYEAVKK